LNHIGTTTLFNPVLKRIAIATLLPCICKAEVIEHPFPATNFRLICDLAHANTIIYEMSKVCMTINNFPVLKYFSLKQIPNMLKGPTLPRHATA
jgi:hypothetical protein